MLKIKHKLSCCVLVKIIILLLLLFLVKNCLIPRSHQNDSETVINKPVLTTSVCDSVIKEEEKDLKPVEVYTGEPAKVDFSTMPEAKLFYTAITEQVAEGPNFAGHYTFAGWGCGTSCAGYAIVDSISGEIIYYLPFNEGSNYGNGFFYDINSRLLIFNPKEDFDHLNNKTLTEVIEDEISYAHMDRQYSVIEENLGFGLPPIWYHFICRENALDGVISREEIGPDGQVVVIYYAKLKQISTSGEARFYRYDTEIEQLDEDEFSWFFAMPKDVPDDKQLTDKWVEFINKYDESIFKITGSFGEFDCEYHNSLHCITDIDVATIEVVGENKIMEF